MKVGLIGLGNMGSGIARSLVKAGHTLIVYNRTRSRAEDFRQISSIAETPGAAASGVEVVVTVLADDHAVEEVIFGRGNVLDSLAPGAVHISISTISVALSRRLMQVHMERKQHYVAAPVFGRPDAAATGKLFVVAGGPADQIERCQPVFQAIGQKTFMAGNEAPMANVVKLCGNFMITTVIESLAESFALVRKTGMDAGQFLEIMTGTLFGAPVYKNYGEIIANEQFETAGFKLILGLKDNRLVLAAAQDAVVPMPLASLIGDHLLAAAAQGMGNEDWSAVSRIAFENAGLARKQQ